MFKVIFSVLVALGIAATSSPALANAPSHPSIEIPKDAFKDVPAPKVTADPRLQGIRLVKCGNKEGNWRGTMFHYQGNRYISAYHVAGDGVCYDVETGVKLTTIHFDKGNDFAILESPVKLDNVFYKLSCEPFKTGQTYHAVGWAGGEDLTSVDITATEKYTNAFFIIEGKADIHMREFKDGAIIPGQSGGPVVDDNWVVYGINNASWTEKNLSWSRELRDTALCSK